MIDAVAEIVEDVGDLAEHLVGQHGRGDEVAAAAAFQLGRAEQGRDGVARMAGAMGETDKGVVEIEIADHHAIGEDREIGAGLGAADQHGRGLLCRDLARELDRDLARTRIIAAIGAADGVEDGAFCQPHDVFGKVLVFEVGRIAGERLGEHLIARRGELSPRAKTEDAGIPAATPAAAAVFRKCRARAHRS